MRVTFAFLLCWLPWLAHAQANGLQVRPADRERFTQEPRQIVATTFIVRNDTPRAIEAEPRLRLPEGWRSLTTDLPFDLAARESALKLISFAIPERAIAGDYSVTYELRDRRNRSLSAAYTVRVHVIAAMKVQVLSLESPEFAIAGEQYASAFLIRNLGNAPMAAKYAVRSAQGAQLEPSAGTVQLSPGQSKRIDISSIAPKLQRRADEQLTLDLQVSGAPIHEMASSMTRIVPRVSRGAAYRTLTSRAEVSFVTRDRAGERVSGWQPALTGAGSLDDANSRYLSFRLRGPDTRDRGSLGTADEYWIRYHDDSMTGALGDGVYGLSPLTEPGRYGSGAQLGYDEESWGVSAYRMHDRFASNGIEQSAFGAQYRPTSDTQLDVNLLDIAGDAFPGRVHSLRTRTRWSSALNTDIEWAASDGEGERGQAFRGDLSGSVRALRYYATGWRADRAYRGYLRDKEYLSAGFDLPRRGSWGLRGYYRLQDWNIEEPDGADLPLDPDRPTNLQDLIRFAPTERQTSLGTERAFGRATRLTLDFNLRTRTDGHSSPQVDVTSRSIRAGLSRSLKNLSFLYALERGYTQNDVTFSDFGTALHLLSASWQASAKQNYGLYAVHDDNAYSNDKEDAQTSFGLSANYALGAAMSVSLNAQRSESQTNRRSLYNVAVVHERADGGRITLIGRRIEGRLDQTDLMLTYSMAFGMPVARKSDVGTVRGRVFDSETGAGLRSVVLNLDGLTAVTDSHGDFEFPAIKASTYRLSMDRANVEIGKVPLDERPLEVQVLAREQQRVEIALVRTVTVSVDVRLRGGGADGAPNVLVTLTRGESVYRRLTDNEGRVKLAGLQPGAWTVALAEDTVPSGYSVPRGTQRLEVAPGSTATASFELAPIVRDIRMLPPMEVR